MPDIRLIDANAIIERLQNYYESLSPDIYSEMIRRDEVSSCIAELINAPTIDAQPVKPMNDKAHWTDTDETVWDARDKDSGEEFEIDIVTAKCSVCGRWAEKVNAFSTYMTYEYCPHCGRKMEVKQ